MRVDFHYSGYYDYLIARALEGVKGFDEGKALTQFNETVKLLENEWRPKETAFVKGIESATGLRFSQSVNCFLTSHDLFQPFSFPMTVGMNYKESKRSTKRLVAIIMHELVHNLFLQNDTPPWDFKTWKRLWPVEAYETQIHVPVYAVLARIPEAEESLEDEMRINREFEFTKLLRAWELVKNNPGSTLEKIRKA